MLRFYLYSFLLFFFFIPKQADCVRTDTEILGIRVLCVEKSGSKRNWFKEPFLPWIQWCHSCYNIHKANKVTWKVKCTKLSTNLLFLLLPAGEGAFLQDCILVAPLSGSRLWCVAKGRVRLAFIVLEIPSLEQGWLYRGNKGKKICVPK